MSKDQHPNHQQPDDVSVHWLMQCVPDLCEIHPFVIVPQCIFFAAGYVIHGAEQNRVVQSLEMLQTNLTNIEAAYGRIVDTDIALESTRFARHNVLVQASAAMTAQANQLTNVALQLLG